MPKPTRLISLRSPVSPRIAAWGCLALLCIAGCQSGEPNSRAPQTPQQAEQSIAERPAEPVPEALPAQLESPSSRTLKGRLIDLDPAVRWAVSYSNIAVDHVEKPSDTQRIYHLIDARQTPMRIEISGVDFTRGHFKTYEFQASASFGRIADESRQTAILRKVQTRLNQLKSRTR